MCQAASEDVSCGFCNLSTKFQLVICEFNTLLMTHGDVYCLQSQRVCYITIGMYYVMHVTYRIQVLQAPHMQFANDQTLYNSSSSAQMYINDQAVLLTSELGFVDPATLDQINLPLEHGTQYQLVAERRSAVRKLSIQIRIGSAVIAQNQQIDSALVQS